MLYYHQSVVLCTSKWSQEHSRLVVHVCKFVYFYHHAASICVEEGQEY